MKHREAPFQKWLEELEQELNLFEYENLNSEANENMFMYGFPDTLREFCNDDDIFQFLQGCFDIYSLKNSGRSKIFYSWLDEQAGQIRVSAISKIFRHLPFGCKVKSCSLSDLSFNIKNNDSGLFTKGVLNVWQADI